MRVGRKKDGDSDEIFAVKVINKRALRDIDSEDLKNEVRISQLFYYISSNST